MKGPRKGLQSKLLGLLPELLKIIELSELTAHQMDYDIAAINQFPTIIPWALMPVGNFHAKFIEQSPDLMDYTSQMRHRCHCSDYEAVGP